LRFILANGTEIDATYADNGTWWVEYTFDEYGVYQVTAAYDGIAKLFVSDGTVNITKANSTLILEDVVLYIGESLNLTVTTEGAIGITANINGTDVSVIDNYTIPISGLAVGNYTLTVTTIPDEDHASVTKTASIIIHNLKYNVNVTSVNTNSRTVHITAESDIYDGSLRLVLSNGAEIKRLNVGPLRIWYKNKKYPGLSITRSFGDFESDELGVISVPDVKEYDIDEGKIKIIVFATDGIWKFLTNDKIMSIVLPYYSQNDVNGACKKISETAIKLWNVKNPKGIADVTVFVLFFK
jgi:hypothetical protein